MAKKTETTSATTNPEGGAVNPPHGGLPPTRAEQVHAELEMLLHYKSIHPSTTGVVKWFQFRELPTQEQRTMGMRFAELAIILGMMPPTADVVVALRELLRARDQALRAVQP